MITVLETISRLESIKDKVANAENVEAIDQINELMIKLKEVEDELRGE